MKENDRLVCYDQYDDENVHGPPIGINGVVVCDPF